MNFTKKSVLVSSGILLGSSFFLITFTRNLVLTPNFFQRSGHSLTALPGQDIILYAELQKWFYLYDALYLALKIGITSLILYTALYLGQRSLAFWRVLNVVILSEFVFIAGAAVKILYFHEAYPQGTLSDWHRVYIFSALSLFPQLPADWYYAMQTVSFFEFGYWVLLAAGLQLEAKLPFGQSFKLVLLSYVPALLLWLCCVSLCSILVFTDQA